MKAYIPLLAILIVAGCGKGHQSAEEAASAQTLSNLSTPGGPSEVLAHVNGTLLLRSEAEAQAAYRLRSMRIPTDVTAAQIAKAKQNAMYYVVDQFITKTLLIQEADALNIDVTEEEEKKAFAKIQERLPEGQTVEDTMNNSPAGRKRMREEVLVGIRIEKLLNQQLGEDFSPTDEEYDAFVAENSDKLTVPESVNARHILLSVSEDEDQSAVKEKMALANEIRDKLANGGDFAALAAEHSSCSSKARGGDLGRFAKGRMAPDFEAAAFSQAIDEIGPVVKTPYGLHIIQVYERSAGGPMDREQITGILTRRRFAETRRDYVKALIDKSVVKLAPTVTPPRQTP